MGIFSKKPKTDIEKKVISVIDTSRDFYVFLVDFVKSLSQEELFRDRKINYVVNANDCTIQADDFNIRISFSKKQEKGREVVIPVDVDYNDNDIAFSVTQNSTDKDLEIYFYSERTENLFLLDGEKDVLNYDGQTSLDKATEKGKLEILNNTYDQIVTEKNRVKELLLKRFKLFIKQKMNSEPAKPWE